MKLKTRYEVVPQELVERFELDVLLWMSYRTTLKPILV
jgi:hypothetical protein